MQTSQTIIAVEHLIEKFGFPIFVALCALIFFWQMFSYMKATVTKKDCDFLAYIHSSNKHFADYAAKRDAQMNLITVNHNRVFSEISAVLERLSESTERRTRCGVGSKKDSASGGLVVSLDSDSPPR